MIRQVLFGLCCITAPALNTQAAEITTCIIDTSIETNQVFYYFPLSKTLLRCDHTGISNPESLQELYAANWRLIHMQSPLLVDKGKSDAAYTPPVLYLERVSAPSANDQQNTVNETNTEDSSDMVEPEKPSRSGIFKFLGGDSTEDF